MNKFKMVSLNKPNLALQTGSLSDLFIDLNRPEYKYKMPVIINDKNEIVAGSRTAFNWIRDQKKGVSDYFK